MRKRIIMGVGGAILFMAGILAGVIISGGIPAFASNNANNTNTAASVSQSHTSSAAGYCQLYETTLAKQLNVSPSTLEKANSAALQAVIDQMAKDGKISSKQESILQQMLQQYSSQPCSHLSQIQQWAKGGSTGVPGANNGMLKQVLSGARQSIETPVAAALGIPTATLDSDLLAGQTIPEIAKTRSVLLVKVNQAYLGAVKGLLAQAVSKGYLTQDQSNALYSRVTASVNAGSYPLLGAGGEKTTPTA